MEGSGLRAAELAVVAQAHDADGAALDRALECVRAFLSERRDRLVLYGGLGLHYMLRQQGGRIYPDAERPDYDFYSGQHLQDAYDLADRLHAAGFAAVDARRALHIQTMRVRVNFVPVADISFVPERVLGAVPRAEVACGGPLVSVVHPHWQFMDQHLALSFPYRDPPREPVFHRFRKDVERFNLLRAAYSPAGLVPAGTLSGDTQVVRFPVPAGCAAHGCGALAALQECLARLQAAGGAGAAGGGGAAGGEPWCTVEMPPAGADAGAAVLACRVPREAAGAASVATTGDADAALAQMGYERVQEYRPLMDLLPAVVHARPRAAVWGAAAGMADVLLHVLPLRLLAASRPLQRPDGADVRAVSAQYMLLQFLLAYHCGALDCALGLLAGGPLVGLALYEAGLEAMRAGGEVLARLAAGWGGSEAEWDAAVGGTPFCLTVQVIGDLNVGEGQLMALFQDECASHLRAADPRVRAHVPARAEVRGLPEVRYRPGVSLRRAKAAEFMNSESSGTSPWFRLDGGAVPAPAGAPAGGVSSPV